MKNLVESLRYIFKNIIFVTGFAIIPAFYIGGLLQPFSIFTFVVDYKNMQVSSFADILSAIFDFNWVNIINVVLSSIIFLLVYSAFIGNIENHFKSGKLKPSSTINFVNNNILSVAGYSVLLFLIYEFFKFFVGLVSFIIQVLCHRLGSTPTLAMFIVFVVIFALMLIGLFYMISVILLSLVDTNICGYSLRTSLLDALDYMSGKVWKTMFIVALPIVIIVPLVVLGKIYNFLLVSNIIGVATYFVYYGVISYVLYFDYARIDRYDNIKRYYKG